MQFLGARLIHFPVWWYKESLVWFKRFFRNLLVFLDNKLALRLMVQMWLVPLFHDTSWLGRSLSLIFRSIRIVVGVIVISLTSLAMGFWLIAWLITPFIVVIGLKEIGWVLLALIWLVDIYRQMNKALVLKPDLELKPGQVKNYIAKEMLALVKQAHFNSQELKQILNKNELVLKLLRRLEIAPQTMANLEALLIYRDWQELALKEALKLRAEQINGQHFLLALLKTEDWRYEEAVETVKWLERGQAWAKTPFLWDKEYVIRPIGGVDRAWTGVPTPTLDKYSTDLTQKAQKAQLPEIIGKKEALDQMSKILSRRQQNNVLVVGEAGSGKTTLVKGIAQEIVRGVKTKSLRFKRLVSLDTSKLAAGANSAELNHRITKIIDEIKLAENIILFVDEVHNLSFLNQDLPETSDVFIALEPPLSEGEFQFIGATTTDKYKKYIEPNDAFARLFEVVDLKEPDLKETMEILEYIAWESERQEEVIITTLALKRIIDLAGQYIHDRVFPDKGVNLLDEVVAVVKSQEGNLVTSIDVEQLVTKKTKVPLTRLTKKDTELLLNLEKKIHQRIVGQDQAVKAVADAIRRARTKLKDPNKPMASFMFAGPTGVGKTETAKALAAEFFGSERVMIRLDMSEYQNLDSLNRLIGAPPGKGGVQIGGQLTEAVRQQPYTLVLLDEIEKAHPKILNIFLQVLDDARLTDSSGRTVDFANTIIIATTNVGTKELLKGIAAKASAQQITKLGLEALEEHFPPELLNRFTGLIVFKSLSRKEIEVIVRMKLNKLTQKLEKQEIKIIFDQDVVKKLAEMGFSEKWGGRQVNRVIQEKVVNVIAQKILKGKLKKKQLMPFPVDELK